MVCPFDRDRRRYPRPPPRPSMRVPHPGRPLPRMGFAEGIRRRHAPGRAARVDESDRDARISANRLRAVSVSQNRARARKTGAAQRARRSETDDGVCTDGRSVLQSRQSIPKRADPLWRYSLREERTIDCPGGVLRDVRTVLGQSRGP